MIRKTPQFSIVRRLGLPILLIVLVVAIGIYALRDMKVGATPGNTRNVNVTTAAELTAALAAARPGDVIHLAPGVYKGNFTAGTPATVTAPIVLTGPRSAILDGIIISKGYTLHLKKANYWHVSGFSILHGQKGIMIDRSKFVILDNLEVSQSGQEGVHFRTFSTDNIIENSYVHNTGLFIAGYGEGVYLGTAVHNWPVLTAGLPDRSDRNQVINNTINHTAAENIDIKEGSTGGRIEGNKLDGVGMTGQNFSNSLIDVKGNNYYLADNVGVNGFRDGFEDHMVVKGWGNYNTFDRNTLTVNSSGFGFSIQAITVGNKVHCNNKVTAAKKGFASVACTA